jgi:hypothetical protein
VWGRSVRINKVDYSQRERFRSAPAGGPAHQISSEKLILGAAVSIYKYRFKLLYGPNRNV